MIKVVVMEILQFCRLNKQSIISRLTDNENNVILTSIVSSSRTKKSRKEAVL